jgi:aquaporin Z
VKKALAEFIGTFTLVLFGCGAAVIAGNDLAGGPEGIGLTGISFAFGLALIAAAYGIGPISGCHINPAVSLAALIADRMEVEDFARYVVAQVLGALAGAAVLWLIVTNRAMPQDVAVGGLGQNGWGPGYLGEYTVVAAFLFETVATFLFVVTILGVTQQGAPSHLAGLAIGLALVVIHLVGIRVTGVSVNPARSIGPAVFVGGNALMQLWLFIVAPCLGAALAGILFRNGALEADGK